MHHKDLEVWKKAIELVTLVYKETKNLPDDEKFGLVSQIRRSVISIPSNIAEGCGRQSGKDTLRFIDISLGSLAELETQIIICEKLEYLSNQEIYNLINKVYALTLGLKRQLLKTLC